MKILTTDAQNILGISSISLKPQKPVIVIAGENGAGKTSLYQGIKLALFDELPRVELMRQAGEIVREGAKNGMVSVTTDVDYSVSVMLPSRDRSSEPLNGMLRLTMEPSIFTGLDNADRAKLVLQLSKVRMDKATIAAKLTARGINKAVLDELDPLLLLGFDSCVDHAKTQAAEHRGAWKQVTGETYGSVKAKSWKVPAAGVIPDAPADLGQAVQKHADASGTLAKLEAARAAFDQHQERSKSDKAEAVKVNELLAKVDELKPGAEADVERDHLACPECGTLLDLNPPSGPDTPAKLVHAMQSKNKVKPAVLAKAKAAYNAALRELTTAQAAAARLASPPTLEARPTDEEITRAKDRVAEAADLLSGITRAQEEYAAAAQAQKDATRRQENASREYTMVEGWEAAREALSPAGIPSELMTQAMAPMRAALNKVCASPHVRNWPLPSIANDGSISAWSRPYGLLSESEKFRVDALFAAAIASFGVKIIAADRADVLSPVVRGEFLSWLVDMVDADILDQAWMFATLKSRPPNFGDTPIEAHWIENGALDD